MLYMTRLTSLLEIDTLNEPLNCFFTFKKSDDTSSGFLDKHIMYLYTPLEKIISGS